VVVVVVVVVAVMGEEERRQREVALQRDRELTLRPADRAHPQWQQQ
jgi:hypothetical protein